MIRTCLGLIVGVVIAYPADASAQIWSHLRRGADSAQSVMSAAALSQNDLASQISAGRVVLSGVRFGSDGALSGADGLQMIRVAEALSRATGRYRVNAFVDAGADTIVGRNTSLAYAAAVRALLVAAGVSPDRLSVAGGADVLAPPRSTAAMIGGSLVSSSGSAAAIADTTRTHTSAGDVVKAAAEDLIPGAKLARLGMRALSSRREAQARADSTARLRLARIEIVKVD